MKKLESLIWDAIYYGFIDLNKFKKFKREEIEYIHSKIRIDNLVLTYKYGDDDEMLTMNCYNIKTAKTVFDWKLFDLSWKFWDFKGVVAKNKFKRYIVARVKEQEPNFFIRLKINDFIFNVAYKFYVEPVNSMLAKTSHKVYRVLHSKGATQHKGLRQRYYNENLR